MSAIFEHDPAIDAALAAGAKPVVSCGMTHRPIRPDIRFGTGDQASRSMRDAFALWTSGVAVVAVHTPAGLHGVTVSAFTPLSLAPPLVLVCLHADAPMLTYIREQQRFTVNLLAAGQKRVAGLYADRFTAVHARFAEESDAIIEGGLAALVCALVDEYQGGDHRILTGEVGRVLSTPGAAPLVYHDRAYRTLAD